MSYPKICCKDMRKMTEAEDEDGFPPSLRFISRPRFRFNDDGFGEYDEKKIEGFCWGNCEGTLYLPCKFCPWCGVELRRERAEKGDMKTRKKRYPK